MSHTGLSVQGAIFAALNGDSNITAGVYDFVPANAAFPYIQIGEIDRQPEDAQGAKGLEQFVTIHVWSDRRGKKEAQEIQGQIYDCLHRQTLAVSGFVLMLLQSENIITDPDGLTRHGISRYRILTMEVS